MRQQRRTRAVVDGTNKERVNGVVDVFFYRLDRWILNMS
jgi:hypothetical protein